MRRFLTERWFWLIPFAGFVLLFPVYFFLHRHQRPAAPAIPIVSTCKKVGPGMRRIGFEFQFDTPAEGFTVEKYASDAPSGAYGFNVKPSNSTSFLDISWEPKSGMESMRPAVDPALNFSGPVENRKILDDEGNSVGEDSWGYWNNNELWRRVRLRGSVVARYGSIKPGDVASYGSVHRNEAALFDKIINSACTTSDPAP